MKLPEDIYRSLSIRWENQHRKWLSVGMDDSTWPLEMTLGLPTEAMALTQPSGLSAWTAVWSNWKGPGQVGWTERRWRTLGTQRMPERLVLHGPAEVAALLGEAERWHRACIRKQKLIERWPILSQGIGRYFDMLADYTDEDYERLFTLLDWLIKNPATRFYPRQLPLAGLDSKWMERRTALIASLFREICGEKDGIEAQDFYARTGLRALPILLRLRILDRQLRGRFGGLCDISAPLEELAQLDLPAKRVLVVENLQSALALPDLEGVVVFMGLGKSVRQLTGISWVRAAPICYWGDIDTHGLHILHQARMYFPDVRSILMDEDTLLSHRELWTQEVMQYTAEDLNKLEVDERSLYLDLKRQRWGHNVRLEQERIAWGKVLQAL